MLQKPDCFPRFWGGVHVPDLGNGLHGWSRNCQGSMLSGLRVHGHKRMKGQITMTLNMLQIRGVSVTRGVVWNGEAGERQRIGEPLLPKPVEPGPEDCCQVTNWFFVYINLTLRIYVSSSGLRRTWLCKP